MYQTLMYVRTCSSYILYCFLFCLQAINGGSWQAAVDIPWEMTSTFSPGAAPAASGYSSANWQGMVSPRVTSQVVVRRLLVYVRTSDAR